MSADLEPTARGILKSSASSPPSSNTNITFAPLPPPVKRSKSKRKRPLGVAGRSTILQQQHRLRKHHSSEPNEEGYPRSKQHTDRRSFVQDDDDDALIELSRLVKEAGKKLWKSLSSRSSSSSLRTATGTDAAKESSDDSTSFSTSESKERPATDNDSDNIVLEGKSTISVDPRRSTNPSATSDS